MKHTIAMACLLLSGCAAVSPAADADRRLDAMMKGSFSSRGIATVDRLEQDPTDAACSRAAGAELPQVTAEALEAANLATIKPPSDGHYLGDWKEGEKLAQNGRGMTWTDRSTTPSANGGNCYNCHQISSSEIAFGTIGPSLWHYGKQRNVSDPASPDTNTRAVIAYTWGKLYNAKAYNACSAMPRFGQHGLLDETQLKHLMALLLDPASPVNR